VKQGVVLLIAAVLATACGGPSHRADFPPAVDQLASMLADESTVNAIMGTTTLRDYYRYRALPGWRQGEVYSRPDCMVVTANAMEPEYAGSHYGEMRGTRLLDSDPAAQTSIDEAVVAFETPAAAQAFVAATVRAWKLCANTVLTITAKDRPTHHWNLGSSRVVDGVDVVDADHADTTRGWRGSRALRASKNVVIDVRVTGFRITDQAVRLVNAIAGRDRL
jgi:PknH-like extracellular domain